MSSPALRGSAEWSARRELALLLGLTRGNHYAAQQLWLRKESIKAEASQGASAGAPQASQQPAGCQAKPATVEARGVPKPKTAAQLARSERGRERLRRKHLARVAKVAPKLQAWLRRARANLERRGAPAPPATPTGPSVAVPESGAELPRFVAARVFSLSPHSMRSETCTVYTFHSITRMAAYQGKSFEELRWEH